MEWAYIQAHRWWNTRGQEVQNSQRRGNRARGIAQEHYEMARKRIGQSGKTESTDAKGTGQVKASKPKGRKPVDPNETREQKLTRLANARVSKAVKYISYIGNLAAYKPEEPQIDKMIEALASACQRVDNRLRGTRTESYTFTLS